MSLSILALLTLLASLVAQPAAAAELQNVEGTPTELGFATRAKSMTVGPEGNVYFAGNRNPDWGMVGYLGATAPVTEWAPPFPETPRTPTEKALEIVAPTDIATGPDGNLWMTARAGLIARLTPEGEITAFSLSHHEVQEFLAEPTGIVAGPDGALWVSSRSIGGAIGRVTTDGNFTVYPVGDGLAQGVRDITLGSDGALWFTEPGAHAIGRITTAGAISRYPLTGKSAEPNQLTLGPDGNVWFTEGNAAKIGRITPSGAITEFAAEAAGPIVSGPFGDLWFGSEKGIGSITVSGVRGPTNCVGECWAGEALATGPEGRLYFGAGPVPLEPVGGLTAAVIRSAPGRVGVFAIPPTQASVAGGKAKAKGARFSLVNVTCGGGAAGQACQGTIGLEAKGTRIGSRKFAVLSGETRSVAVRLTGAGLRAFGRRKGLSGRVTVRIPGASAVTAKVTLARPPRLR